MMSDDLNEPVDDPKVTSGRHKCIVMGLVVVAALAITAIVLPLVLDNCDCPPVPTPNVQAGAPTPAPGGPPTTPAPNAPPGSGQPTPAPTPQGTAPTASPAPSLAPSTNRLGQLIQMFLEPLSGEAVFNDKTSPQYMAAEFLADEDEIAETLPSTEHVVDRYALTTFYFATEGPISWLSCSRGDQECGEEVNAAWLDPSTNHCDWAFVTCNDDGRVTEVFFEVSAGGNGLVGDIPPEFALLSELEVFVAINNFISGNFPTGFGDLTNVKRVILNANSMTGVLPEGFLQNSPVELFLVANNTFSGNIPASFGSIPTLQQLVLAGNNFSGTIPQQLGQLENLGTLDLSRNIRIRGSIPQDIYSLAFLENLYLDGCTNLQGTLSGDISQMQSLKALRLGNTGMAGALPAGIFTLNNLVELDLTGANFSGQLSEQFLSLSPTLRILNLSGNNFSGDIPAAFELMTLLNSLELFGNNQITGNISNVICGRRGTGRNQLQELTAPCDLSCTCCTNTCR